LKSPYRDGTTHVVFEPLDFLSRLAALVPSPGVNLTRYHGVFAPNHRLRARIVPGFTAPPHCSQRSISIPNTRFRRCGNRWAASVPSG
jgi:Putative transposase